MSRSRLVDCLAAFGFELRWQPFMKSSTASLVLISLTRFFGNSQQRTDRCRRHQPHPQRPHPASTRTLSRKWRVSRRSVGVAASGSRFTSSSNRRTQCHARCGRVLTPSRPRSSSAGRRNLPPLSPPSRPAAAAAMMTMTASTFSEEDGRTAPLSAATSRSGGRERLAPPEEELPPQQSRRRA